MLDRHAPGCAGLAFMTAGTFAIGGVEALISRSGYTGEDGFEISVPEERGSKRSGGGWSPSPRSSR